ncbi:hypothetical protein [Epiphyas postvittana nucleopolyhedrovirus]|uniref:Uncharacterized protein n=1 Tax=Epiphyas postvittana nucleopolyhedrovirus TaxID=70600 RepID=Q91GI8_NPVEP|nr:hypothetical protein [Epiphyas postvittana nucleopolyhedrovirus]AAK85629.1 unknown [Epiphyas postvittana nucleopolyhedrovirus]
MTTQTAQQTTLKVTHDNVLSLQSSIETYLNNTEPAGGIELEDRLFAILSIVNSIVFDEDQTSYTFLKTNLSNCINILLDLITIKQLL